MSIDISSLSRLVSDFRALQAKDSISPESLGFLLQAILDLLSTASSDSSQEDFKRVLNRINEAGPLLSEISQAHYDSDAVYMEKNFFNLASGAGLKKTSLFIQPASSERAGVMTARHASELSDSVSKIKALGNSLDSLRVSATGKVYCQVVGSTLKVRGAEKYTEAGFIPYLFRFTRKRNRIRDHEILAKNPGRRFSPETKGWNLYGSCHTVRIEKNNLSFSTADRFALSRPPESYSYSPEALVRVNYDSLGRPGVAWGRKVVKLVNRFDSSPRLVRLRYAIAFGPRLAPSKRRITPAQMVSPLAEFSLVYDPKLKGWAFGK